jgi:hypothetical protein
MAMRFRTCSALLLLLSACATTTPTPDDSAPPNRRIANLQRAAQYPWADDGQCAVREASNEWPVLAKRCFHALDHERIRFQDVTGRCALAAAGVAVVGVGICIFAAPEIITGAIIITGAVVVPVAIHEGLEAYARRRRANPEAGSSSGRAEPVTDVMPEEPHSERRPEPGSSSLGRDWIPPASSDPTERGPECTPRRVPPKGGHPGHNECADNIPFNAFRGANALVNGKAFDALRLPARILWEVKTDNFDTYTEALQDIVIDSQVPKLLRELELARACGFDFRVGVRSAAHKAALEEAEPRLEGIIVVMDWC